MTRAEKAITKIAKNVKEFNFRLDQYPGNGGRVHYSVYTMGPDGTYGRKLGSSMTISELEQAAELIADIEFQRQWERERQQAQS